MAVQLESDLLRTFVAVVDTGNFTKAAEQVGRTQSAVSMQMKKLEEVVGEILFERGSRGVVLTRHGGQLLGNARRVVALLDETAASMRMPQLSGTVRIGLPEEYLHSVLPRALGAFDKMHPDVEITVKYGRSAVNIAALERGELDIAVAYEQGNDTRSEVLMTDPTVWVTSDLHSVHELSPLPVAMYAVPGWCVDLSLQTLEQRREPYRIAYWSDTSIGLLAAVTSGLAIAPLSRSSIPAGCRELTTLEGYRIIDFSNVILRQNSRRHDKAVEGMASAIREAFQSSLVTVQ
ncbi:LysR substrate-binding domain-containing protein [Pararhizobium sp.]|uniref:LysR substrate-binding domain-containing protein n=1 Tax=Pararhizobium sp. TaxID=1977563 RepID=UPI002723678C|nr:LysR substrate-binding domain-containing protein [Pararhizobium sp.]MDO9414761.1 LysR family transcriptional regulator [Pararhizobium sp.]